ncbi:MAG: hypothetical protein JSS79_16905 [Bacteroidetes bacterium]|nr:hypothetical protein [Bacteroidota bacterium]
MKNRIKTGDSLIELSGAAIFVALYLTGYIGLGYAVMGVVVSLSIWLPFKAKDKSAAH